MGTSIPNIGSTATGDPVGKAVVELTLADKAYEDGLKKSEKSLGLFDKRTQKIARRAGKAFLVAGTAITAALVGVITHAARAGDELDKMSLRTGVSVENLSRLSFAAERSGSNVTALETGLRFLSRRMDESSKGIGIAKEAFESLGINITDTEGKLRAQPEVIKEIATAIAGLESETQQVAIAMDIFGARSGPGLLPLLKQGESGIQELMDRADELGIVMSTQAAAASAEFTDKMLDLTKSLKMAGFELGQTLLPAAQQAVEAFTEAIAEFNKLDEGTKKIIGYSTAVGGLFAIFTGVGLLVIARLAALSAGLRLLGPAIASVGFAAAATGALALGTSIWAITRAVKAARDPLNFFIGQIRALEIANEGAYTAIGILERAMIDAEKNGIDPLSASIDDLGVDVEKLNEKLNVTPGLIDRLAETAGNKATIIGALFDPLSTAAGAIGAVLFGAGKSIEAIIPGTANAADTVDMLSKRMGEAAEKAKSLKGEADGAGEKTDEMGDSAATATPKINALTQSLLELTNQGELWFLKAGTLTFDRMPIVREDSPFDPVIQHGREAVEGLEAIQADIDAIPAPKLPEFEEPLETLLRRADARLAAAEGKSESDQDRKNKKWEADQDKRAKEDKKRLVDAVNAQERAAAEILREWMHTRNRIQFAFEDLFTDMFIEGKADWTRFWDDLVRIALGKISEIVMENTIGNLLDRIAGMRQTGQGGVAIAGPGIQPARFQPDVIGGGSVDHVAPIGPTQTGQPLQGGADPIVAFLASLQVLSKIPDIFKKAAGPATGDPILDAAIRKSVGDLRFAFPEEAREISVHKFSARAGQLIDVIMADYNEFMAGVQPGSKYIPPNKWGIFGLQKGGIVREPTLAMIGESGPEAVIPLPVSGNIGGDTYLRIERLELNMPPTIAEMPRAELDKQTSRQIDSIARALRRNPGAQRNMR